MLLKSNTHLKNSWHIYSSEKTLILQKDHFATVVITSLLRVCYAKKDALAGYLNLSVTFPIKKISNNFNRHSIFRHLPEKEA